VAAGTAALSAPPGVSPDVPVGTVIGGKRKVVFQTPFSTKVVWVDVEQPASAASNQPGNPNK
jgi:hypothetical protein